MEFDRLLEHFDNSAGQKEQIALIFYYYEEHEGEDDVTQSDVKDVIRRSRSSISPSSVATYFRRLNGDWITSTENDDYRLTLTGKREVQSLLDEGVLEDHREEDDFFIDTEIGDDERHEKLIEDINDCYRYRIYDGTMVLTRKFFEDIVFQILKIHYAGDDVQKFYDQDNQRHYSFDELLTNLKESVPTLRQYSRELNREMVEELRDLKDEGNTGAHSIRVDFSDEEVEAWSDDATRMAEILYEVLLGARIADEQDS